ncbi:beta-lactamase-like protein [Gongronella butleri]|nr:beta-lactamase-like protein [Gongronella butleri]
MVVPMDITFLGTSSAQPSSTRNHQSMALRVNGDVWLFDCGEATQHQVQKSQVKMSRISKVFITHMHGDHCFGLCPLLCSIGKISDDDDAPIEIYGPSRLRQWVRTTLNSTYAALERCYRVHEILQDDDPEDTSEDLHPQELPGRNYRLDAKEGDALPAHVILDIGNGFKVTAAPIVHRVPTLGFVVQEPEIAGNLDMAELRPHLMRNADALRAQGIKQPLSLLSKLQRQGEPIDLPDGTRLMPPAKVRGRQVVILGDTCDSAGIVPFCDHPQLLVHEATNALTSMDLDDATHEQVVERTVSHGHSTPQMAGAFAKRIGARNLILTHFSSRYKGDTSDASLKIMEEIRQLALSTYGDDKDANLYCARDLWDYQIKL